MASNPKTKSDILIELFGGRFVGGALSQLANYSDLFTRMHEAVFLLERHSYRILECNPAACKLLKKDESELLGEPLMSFFPKNSTDLEQGIKTQMSFPLDFKNEKNDERFYEVTSTQLKILDYIEVMQVMINDVTEVKIAHRELNEANAVLQKLSTTDEMTGLWNFRYFKDALQSVHHHAITQNDTYSVVFIDVDHFKKFNDRNGHPAGDQVLKQVAKLIKSQLKVHELAARYGGEEFVVLCRNSSVEQARVTAEQIRSKIESTPFPFGEFQPLGKVTVSIGVSGFSKELKAEQVLNQADLALYQSKERGRNSVTLYQDIADTKKSA